jgi:hypothetical protein
MTEPQYRTIVGLRWAHPLPSRPDCIPASRPRGAKAAGLRFERELAKALPSCLHGTWFEFEDKLGHGYCQADVIYTLGYNFAAVIEVKYTLVPGAHSKLLNLYVPIVSRALNIDCVGVVAVKNLDPRYRRGRIYTDLPSAAQASVANSYPALLQWSGQPLLPSLRSAADSKVKAA